PTRVADLAKVAVVAEGEPPRRIGERLRVRELERRQLRRTADVEEEAGRLLGADPLRAGVVIAERADVSMAGDPAVARQPGSAPAEAGHAEPLEALREGPQLVDAERLTGPGDIVLAHGRDDTRDPSPRTFRNVVASVGWRMDGPQALRLGERRGRVTDATDDFAARIDARIDGAYRLATVILGNALDAEDAVADAALNAWRSRSKLRDADRFDAWFGRI